MTTTQIKFFDKEQLVNILSTGLFGNNAIGADCGVKVNPNSKYHEAIESPDEEDTLEDGFAQHLLNGGTLILWDLYAEEEDDTQGRYSETAFWNEDLAWMGYPVTYDEFIGRLNKVLASGGEDAEYCVKLVSKVETEDTTFDLWDGWNLLQYVMFGELIYG